MAGTLLLVALPPSRVALVALRGRQPIHPEPLEDSPHPRRADLDVVVALQVHPDLHGPEVVMLAQVDDLFDHVGMSDRRAIQRCTRPILEAFETLVFVPALPARIVSLASVAGGASYPDLARRSRRTAPTGSGGAVVTEVSIQRRSADPEVLGDIPAGMTVGLHPLGGGDVFALRDLSGPPESDAVGARNGSDQFLSQLGCPPEVACKLAQAWPG